MGRSKTFRTSGGGAAKTIILTPTMSSSAISANRQGAQFEQQPQKRKSDKLCGDREAVVLTPRQELIWLESVRNPVIRASSPSR